MRRRNVKIAVLASLVSLPAAAPAYAGGMLGLLSGS